MIVERITLPRTAEGRLDEDAWHALRREDVTASDLGALFQVHQRTTALGLYVDKTQGPARGDTQAARRGRLLEPYVAAELALRWPDAEVVKSDEYLRGRDPADEHLRIGATPDYVVTRDGRRATLEIKTVNAVKFRRTWIRASRPEPPLDYVFQARAQAMLAGTDEGMLAALVCDESEEILTWSIERIPRVEEAIRRRVSIFWRAVAAGTYPMLELGREATAFDRMPRSYAAVTPMLGDPRASALATRHQERAAQIAEAQRELREIEDELRGMMDGAAAVILPDARRVVAGRYPGGRRLRVW